VYGKKTDFRDEQFARKLFKSAHKMQLDSLADESANFIGGHDFDADVVFSWYDLFAQKGNAVGLNLLSKVCVLRSSDVLVLANFNLLVFLFQFDLRAEFLTSKTTCLH
jgi:hypothetical protein